MLQLPVQKDHRQPTQNCEQGAEKQPENQNLEAAINSKFGMPYIYNQQKGWQVHTSAGISMGYAAKESIISEIDTATVFLSTATRPRESE
jgi:hypothetical protein